MFCGKCGAQNPDDYSFCYQCGAQIIKEHQRDADGAGVYDTYGSGAALYGGNVVAVSTVPMLPDGSPFECDDYLKMCPEYKKQKFYYQFLWVTLLIVGSALCIGIGILISGTIMGLLLRGYGFFYFLVIAIPVSIGAFVFLYMLVDKYTKKKIRACGDSCYQKYLGYFEKDAAGKDQAAQNEENHNEITRKSAQADLNI